MARIALSAPHLGSEEREALLAAYDSTWVAPLGPDVDAFEREICERTGAPHAVALSSGTAALHLALLLLDIGSGDEVLGSSLTFAASANVVRYVGARPVFVDADADTWDLDPELLAEALADGARRGRLPRALLVVDLYGQCADYDRIRAICADYEIPVIQDSAEALGASYRGVSAGRQGELGVFSFNGNKVITAGGGGMLLSESRSWVDRARFLATQAREPALHYEHRQVGYNYRLSNLLAALGRAQLRKLADYVARRRAHFAAYERALSGLPGWSFMPEAAYGVHSRWLTCALVDPRESGIDRTDIIRHLGEHDVESRPVWKPMHLQPVYADCRMYGGKVSEALFDRGLCLPSGSALSESERERVVELILERYRRG